MESEKDTCSNCNKEVDKVFVCSDCGNEVCQDCIEECQSCDAVICNDCSQLECHCCHETICQSCKIECSDCEKYYCSDCINECASCSNNVCKDCSIICNDCNPCHNIYCGSCSVSCSQCGDSFCNSCIRRCSNCGDSICSHCEYCGEDYDCYYCSGCHDDHCNDGRDVNLDNFSDHPMILEYSTIADWKFIKEPWENTIYMGIELEMGFPCGKEKKIFDETVKILKGKHIWKSDASISGNGAELVITPHTLQCLKKIDWKKYFESIIVHGARSYDNGNCGLHVHVNEDAIKEKDLNKLRGFFCFNRSFIKKFSARTQSSFDNYAYIPKRWNDDWGRGAIYPSGKGTYEFRIFRGTLEANRFKASLMFVQAIIEFVKQHGFAFCNSDRGLNGFFYYCKKNYPVLYRYCGRKGFCNLDQLELPIESPVLETPKAEENVTMANDELFNITSAINGIIQGGQDGMFGGVIPNGLEIGPDGQSFRN